MSTTLSTTDTRSEVNMDGLSARDNEVEDSDKSVAEDAPILFEIGDISLHDDKDDSVLDGNSISNDSVINTSEHSGNDLQQILTDMSATTHKKKSRDRGKRKRKINHNKVENKVEKDPYLWKKSLVRKCHLKDPRNPSKRVEKKVYLLYMIFMSSNCPRNNEWTFFSFQC